MNINEEVVRILANGAIYEIFIVLAMYQVFEIMLNLGKQKRKIFFAVFILDMMATNIPMIYLKYYEQSYAYVDFIIFVLSVINSLVYIGALKILADNDYLHIFLTDIVAATIAGGIVSSIYNWMINIVGKKQEMIFSMYLTYHKIPVVLLLILVVMPFILLERIILKKVASNFYKRHLKYRWLYWGIVLVFYFSGYIVTAISDGDLTFWITNIVLLSLSILLLYEVSWWVRRRREQQIKKENQILSIENAVMKEYYDTLDYQMERTRKFRHDIEKHMTVLKEMLSSSENKKELMDYAKQIEEQYSYLKTINYCGNPVVNAILLNKKNQCEEQNIEMEIEIGEFDLGEIKEIDLIAVISNLLDNAIEECMQSKKDRKEKIGFQCGKKAENLLISVCNTTEKDMLQNDESKKTWKEDTYAHGVGLTIVKEIVEKYDGMFQMEIVDGMCEVTVGLTTKLCRKGMVI